MAYTSRLTISRAELAALAAQAISKDAGALIRASSRYAPARVKSAVPETAWHPATQLDTQARRGTSSANLRGSAEDRRRRKQYLLDTYGDGHTTRCQFCRVTLVWETLTVDRFPIPGRLGGRYTRDNIRPACGPCNSEDQGRAGVLAITEGANA